MIFLKTHTIITICSLDLTGSYTNQIKDWCLNKKNNRITPGYISLRQSRWIGHKPIRGQVLLLDVGRDVRLYATIPSLKELDLDTKKHPAAI